MPKTALITGATGLLGRQILLSFQRAGYNVIGTGYTRASPPSILKLDLNSAEDVALILDDVKPEVLIHSAANRFPDLCTSDPDGTRALNITASATLATLCRARGILLIYISTDYVFAGLPGEAPYSVDDTPKPSNFYGVSKWEGEKAVLRTGEDEEGGKGGDKEEGEGMGRAVVLRVPVLYGSVDEGKGNAESAVNGLMDVVWKVQKEEGRGTKMDDWAIRYPTCTEDVGRVCADIATLYLSTPPSTPLPPILHFSSEDKMTKYEICEVFTEIMGLPLDGLVANKEGNDPNAEVQRPYDCHLSTDKLKELGVNVSTMDFRGWWRREVGAFRK